MKAAIEPGWFSLADAARYSGFSEVSIRAAIDLKQLPHREVSIISNGGKPNIRIKREHVDRWIDGGTFEESDFRERTRPAVPPTARKRKTKGGVL